MDKLNTAYAGYARWVQDYIFLFSHGCNVHTRHISCAFLLEC